jgi:DNA-binding transcriptional ArsR family regulator
MFSMPEPQTRSALDEHSAAHVAELFRAFSDSGRVRVLSALLDQELNVGALANRLGVTESAISHRLRGLRQMRLVKARRDGQKVYYGIEDEHIVALLQQGIRHATDA